MSESGQRTAATTKHIVVVLIRLYNQELFLFAADGPAGSAPFMQQLDISGEMPPTMSSGSMLTMLGTIVAKVGADSSVVQAYEMLPTDTLRPFQDLIIYPVIVDLTKEGWEEIRRRHPNAPVIAATKITQNSTTNMFFRIVAEHYAFNELHAEPYRPKTG